MGKDDDRQGTGSPHSETAQQQRTPDGPLTEETGTDLGWPVTSAAVTETGLVRRENQDAVLDRPDRGLWAVADGMGGHAEGQLASAAVIAGLAAVADGPDVAPPDVLVACGHALTQTHADLLDRSARTGAERPPGSTVVVFMMRAGHFLCLWAGDSRAYRYRHGRLERLTRDHTVVQAMVDAGHLTPEQAETHPTRHALMRAVGAVSDLQVDQVRDPVCAGDLFLLCSDGVSGVLSDAVISARLGAGIAAAADDGGRVRAILEGLRQAVYDAGAPDNLSAVIILVGGDSPKGPA